MRILHVLDHSIPLHSGYTFRTQAILEHQRALGWETFHITSSKQVECDVEEETVSGLHFFRTKQPTNFIARIPLLNQIGVISSLRERLFEIVRKVNPDIIHAHSSALNGVAAIQTARKFNIPVVYESRAFWEDAAVDHGTSRPWGVRYRLTRAMETWVFKRADAVTTICNGLKNEIVSRGINDEKVTVIPNAVNAQKFGARHAESSSLKKQLGLEDKVVLGFVGSFYAYEGLSLLLDAMPEVLRGRSDVVLLLVGGGPEEKNLKAQCDALRLNEAVTFTGRVPHELVNAYYDLIDVCVYPRVSMRLTELVTPLKPLEAMAHKRLVIASNIGGHRELIENDVTGVLFEPENVSSLAGVILNTVSSGERWSEFHSAGRRFVEAERSWPNSVSRYKDVYASALSC